jgi:hypothetical protein
MKIVRVAATPLNVPLHIDLVGRDRTTSLEACHVEVETDDAMVGHARAAITRLPDAPGPGFRNAIRAIAAAAPARKD